MLLVPADAISMAVAMGKVPGIEALPGIDHLLPEDHTGGPVREIPDRREETEAVIVTAMAAQSLVAVERMMEMGLQARVVPALKGSVVAETLDLPVGRSQGEIDRGL